MFRGNETGFRASRRRELMRDSTVDAAVRNRRAFSASVSRRGLEMMVVGRLGFAAMALVLLSITGCGRGIAAPSDGAGMPEASVWRLLSPADPQATALEIEVVSGGCLNLDGPDDVMPVESIDVVETSSAVEISVTLGPMPQAALDRCCDEGGLCHFPAVGFASSHIVQLVSPLGDRELVDSACDEKRFNGGVCEHPAR